MYFIYTVNDIKDIPDQLQSRILTIDVQMPDAQARKQVLDLHLRTLSNDSLQNDGRHGTILHKSCTKAILWAANKADKFSCRDMVSLAQGAVRLATARCEAELFSSKQRSQKKEEEISEPTLQTIEIKDTDIYAAFAELKKDVLRRDENLHWYSTWAKATPVLDYTFTRVVLPMAGLVIQAHYAHKGAMAQELQQAFQEKAHEEQKRSTIAQMTMQMRQTLLGLNIQSYQGWFQYCSAEHPHNNWTSTTVGGKKVYLTGDDWIKKIETERDNFDTTMAQDIKNIEAFINGTTQSLDGQKLLGQGTI